MNNIPLTILFGEDQKRIIDGILDKLSETDNVLSYARHLKAKDKEQGNILEYSILFKDAYSIYLFGHRQGVNKGMEKYFAL